MFAPGFLGSVTPNYSNESMANMINVFNSNINNEYTNIFEYQINKPNHYVLTYDINSATLKFYMNSELKFQKEYFYLNP